MMAIFSQSGLPVKNSSPLDANGCPVATSTKEKAVVLPKVMEDFFTKATCGLHTAPLQTIPIQAHLPTRLSDSVIPVIAIYKFNFERIVGEITHKFSFVFDSRSIPNDNYTMFQLIKDKKDLNKRAIFETTSVETALINDGDYSMQMYVGHSKFLSDTFKKMLVRDVLSYANGDVVVIHVKIERNPPKSEESTDQWDD